MNCIVIEMVEVKLCGRFGLSNEGLTKCRRTIGNNQTFTGAND